MGWGDGKRGIGYPTALTGLPTPPSTPAGHILSSFSSQTLQPCASIVSASWLLGLMMACPQLPPVTGLWAVVASALHTQLILETNTSARPAVHELKPGVLGPTVTLHVPPWDLARFLSPPGTLLE